MKEGQNPLKITLTSNAGVAESPVLTRSNANVAPPNNPSPHSSSSSSSSSSALLTNSGSGNRVGPVAGGTGFTSSRYTPYTFAPFYEFLTPMDIFPTF